MLCALIVADLGFYLVVYLSVPAYRFEAPKPFSGEYLHNPYQDMQPDNWKKCNFHCHSRKYFGITNGRKSKEAAIDSVYARLGYDHFGISDYMRINRCFSDKTDFIPAYEHGYGLFRKTHQLCIGAESLYRLDFPFMQNLDIKQHVLNKLSEKCRFAVPAHASFTQGYKVSDMKYLSNYKLLEILNPYGDGLAHWDMALSNGHRVYGIGNDDTHDVTQTKEVCRYMTLVNVQDLTAEAVYQAFDKGLCYTMEFVNYYFFTQSFDFKREKVRNLPRLTRAELVGDTLFVETSAAQLHEVTFIGQNGKPLKTLQNVKSAFYVIQPEDTYVRTVINIDELHIMYLNPVTRHATPSPIDPTEFSINRAQTAMFRFVYIVVGIALVWYLFQKAKQKRSEHDSK